MKEQLLEELKMLVNNYGLYSRDRSRKRVTIAVSTQIEKELFLHLFSRYIYYPSGESIEGMRTRTIRSISLDFESNRIVVRRGEIPIKEIVSNMGKVYDSIYDFLKILPSKYHNPISRLKKDLDLKPLKIASLDF